MIKTQSWKIRVTAWNMCIVQVVYQRNCKLSFLEASGHLCPGPGWPNLQKYDAVKFWPFIFSAIISPEQCIGMQWDTGKYWWSKKKEPNKTINEFVAFMHKRYPFANNTWSLSIGKKDIRQNWKIKVPPSVSFHFIPPAPPSTSPPIPSFLLRTLTPPFFSQLGPVKTIL